MPLPVNTYNVTYNFITVWTLDSLVLFRVFGIIKGEPFPPPPLLTCQPRLSPAYGLATSFTNSWPTRPHFASLARSAASLP